MGGGRLEHVETINDFCPFRNTFDSCGLSRDFSVKKDEIFVRYLSDVHRATSIGTPKCC